VDATGTKSLVHDIATASDYIGTCAGGVFT
jgi:hypothetical protein